jgi:hypothetical protein
MQMLVSSSTRDSFGVEAGVVSLKLSGAMILLWVLPLGLLRREGYGIYNEESYRLMVFPRRVR